MVEKLEKIVYVWSESKGMWSRIAIGCVILIYNELNPKLFFCAAENQGEDI